MREPALIVIDMVNDFLDAWQAPLRQNFIETMKELVCLIRSLGRPVIWVRQEFRPDLTDGFREMRAKNIRITIQATRGAQIADGLEVAACDFVIIKKRYSAFFGTELEEVLARLKPDGLVLAGVNTHACVRMSAIDAYQRDREVVVAADCVGSYDREHHDISLRYMHGKIAAVMSNPEIRAMLLAAGPGARMRATTRSNEGSGT